MNMKTRGLKGYGITAVLLLLLLVSIKPTTVAAGSARSCRVPETHPTIQTAVDDPSCDKVVLAAGTYAENVMVTRSVRVVGSGNLESIIDGTSSGTVVTIASELDVRLKNLVVQHGRNQLGGGIYNDSSKLRLTSVVLSNNMAVPGPAGLGEGGGLYNDGGQVVIKASALTGNSATPRGGGIYNTGKLTLNNTFLSNGGVIGGGFYNTASGTVTIRNSSFSASGGQVGNHFYNDGGVVKSRSTLYADANAAVGSIQNTTGAQFTSNGDTFSNNHSSSGPGGAIINSGTMKLRNCLFEDNSASLFGGAFISSSVGSVNIKKCTFANNTATLDGGAIFNSGELFMARTAVVDNTAGGNGGGIASEGTLTLKRTVTFFGNQATDFDNVWNTGSCSGCPS
ncbi:MAG: hypothetical protein AAF614_37525 [Chloroflexota bacterium]